MSKVNFMSQIILLSSSLFFYRFDLFKEKKKNDYDFFLEIGRNHSLYKTVDKKLTVLFKLIIHIRCCHHKFFYSCICKNSIIFCTGNIVYINKPLVLANYTHMRFE